MMHSPVTGETGSGQGRALTLQPPSEMDAATRARLLFGADALFASMGLLQDNEQDRAIACDYVKLLFSMAQQEPREHTPSELRSAVTLLGAVRRHLSSELQVAALPGGASRRAWRYWRGSECPPVTTTSFGGWRRWLP